MKYKPNVTKYVVQALDTWSHTAGIGKWVDAALLDKEDDAQQHLKVMLAAGPGTTWRLILRKESEIVPAQESKEKGGK